jgi:hypothetical protein
MRIVLCFLLAVLPALAQAEWIKLGTVDDGAFSDYVDLDSIRGKGDVVRFSLVRDYATVQTTADKKFTFRSSKSQVEIDCLEEQSKGLAVSLHSEPMAGGQVVYSSSDPGSARSRIGPGTVASAALKIVCKKK